jgi:hypothetical protein
MFFFSLLDFWINLFRLFCVMPRIHISYIGPSMWNTRIWLYTYIRSVPNARDKLAFLDFLGKRFFFNFILLFVCFVVQFLRLLIHTSIIRMSSNMKISLTHCVIVARQSLDIVSFYFDGSVINLFTAHRAPHPRQASLSSWPYANRFIRFSRK